MPRDIIFTLLKFKDKEILKATRKNGMNRENNTNFSSQVMEARR